MVVIMIIVVVFCCFVGFVFGLIAGYLIFLLYSSLVVLMLVSRSLSLIFSDRTHKGVRINMLMDNISCTF